MAGLQCSLKGDPLMAFLDFQDAHHALDSADCVSQNVGRLTHGADAHVQGLHTAKVKSKRALLVEEGVQFSGTKIKASCVLDAEELLVVAANAAE